MLDPMPTGFERRADTEMRGVGFSPSPVQPKGVQEMASRPNLFSKEYTNAGGFKFIVTYSSRDVAKDGEDALIARMLKGVARSTGQ